MGGNNFFLERGLLLGRNFEFNKGLFGIELFFVEIVVGEVIELVFIFLMFINNVFLVLVLGDIFVFVVLYIIGDDGCCNLLVELEILINEFFESGIVFVFKLILFLVELVGRLFVL